MTRTGAFAREGTLVIDIWLGSSFRICDLNSAILGISDNSLLPTYITNLLKVIADPKVQTVSMASYGKRKKGLLSSFTVFQDDKPEKETKQQRSSEYIPNLQTCRSDTSSLVSLRAPR